MKLATLLTKISQVSKVLPVSYGFDSKTKDTVPYQMITHLYSSPVEYNELKRLTYAGARQGERNPYSDEFAKNFDGYLRNMREKVLPKLGYEIVELGTISGARFLYLKETDKS